MKPGAPAHFAAASNMALFGMPHWTGSPEYRWEPESPRKLGERYVLVGYLSCGCWAKESYFLTGILFEGETGGW